MAHKVPCSPQTLYTYNNIRSDVFTGSTFYVYASTISGSPLLMKGNIVIDGFTASGSITAGNIVVVASVDDQVAAASAAGQKPIGVAYASASAGGNVQIIREGVVNLTASGSITRGQTLGTSVWGAGYVQAQGTGSQIVGVALNSTGSASNVRVLLQLM